MDESADNSATDSNQALTELRQEAISTLIPLIDQINGAPDKKFELLITAARSAGDTQLLKKALESAKQLEGDDQKAEAVLDVLNEINLNLKNQ